MGFKGFSLEITSASLERKGEAALGRTLIFRSAHCTEEENPYMASGIYQCMETIKFVCHFKNMMI